MASVVITGASTGIGLATTKVLVEKGIQVFGSVRKVEDGEKLQSKLGPAFIPLVFDVSDKCAVQEAAQKVRCHLGGQTLFGLVNNAGISIPGPIISQPVDDYRLQLEVNLVGQLIVTQAFLPLLGVDRSLIGNKPGRIVNISSVSGKIAVPFLSFYSATKHGLEGFSESLRRELMLYGIDVIIVAPGWVSTKIWDKAKEMDLTQYSDTEYSKSLKKFGNFMVDKGKNGYPPERIGQLIWKVLTIPRPRTRYTAVPNPLLDWIIPRALPNRIVDKLLALQFGLRNSN